MGSSSSKDCTNNEECIEQLSAKGINKIFFVNNENIGVLSEFLKRNGLKLEKDIQPGKKHYFKKDEKAKTKVITLGDETINDKQKHKFNVYTVKIAYTGNDKYKNIIEQLTTKDKEQLKKYIQTEMNSDDFDIDIFEKGIKSKEIQEILKKYDLNSNLSLDDLKNIIKQLNIPFVAPLGEGGGKRKVRKHKGIVQTGGNCGRLKKGYKYTGKRTKTGLPIITKT